MNIYSEKSFAYA